MAQGVIRLFLLVRILFDWLEHVEVVGGAVFFGYFGMLFFCKFGSIISPVKDVDI